MPQESLFGLRPPRRRGERTDRIRRLALALLLSVLAAGPAAALTSPSDLEPIEARGEGPLHSGEPLRILLRIANHGNTAACALEVTGDLAGHRATADYANHAAGSVAEVALDYPALPPGNHSLAARVTASSGCHESNTDNNARSFPFRLDPRPTVSAALAASPLRGRAPADVTLSLAAPGATGWTLLFGDGAQTSGQGAPPSTVAHLYSSPGLYTARLTARNGTAEAVATAVVEVEPPVQLPTVTLRARPEEGAVPLIVEFTAEGAGEVLSWRLDFGDGEAAEGTGSPPLLRHTYRTPGTAVARWTATVPDGTVEAQARVRALNAAAAPPAVALAANRTEGPAPLAVTLTPSSDPAPSAWRLVWGDGAEVHGSGPPPPQHHTYLLPGSYRAVFEARNDEGAQSAASILFQARGAGLSAGAPFLSADQSAGPAPLAVTWTAGCACRDVLSWRLDFGDGAAAWGEGAPPAIPHLYPPGNHTARLSLQTLRGPLEAAPVSVSAHGPTAARLALTALPGGLRASGLPAAGAADPWELALPGNRSVRGAGPLALDLAVPPGPQTVDLRVAGLTVDRATVQVAAPAPPLLLAEPASGTAPLTTALVLRFEGALLHWGLDWGDGASESEAGTPTRRLHTYGPGEHQARMVLVTAWGEVLHASVRIQVAPTPPRLEFTPHPGALEIRAEGGALTLDGHAVPAFADAALSTPAGNRAGSRFIACPPGNHTLQLIGPWGVAERPVRCVGAATASRQDVDFGGAEAATTRDLPAPAALAVALAAAAAALRGRRGAALLLVALLLATGAQAHWIRNTSWSRAETAAGDSVDILGAPAGALEVLAPDGTWLEGGMSVAVPPGLPADGTWIIYAAGSCSAGWRVAYRLGPWSGEAVAATCAMVWKVQPDVRSRAYDAVVGGRHADTPPGSPAENLRATGGSWYELYTYHPWGPPDYELYATGGHTTAIAASLTDYDEDGTPTTGELARGTCVLSGRAACPTAPASGVPDGLRAALHWPRGAWSGVADAALLSVEPPGAQGSLTAVEVEMPEGWTLDPAGSAAPASWQLEQEGSRIRLRGPPDPNPLFHLALTPPALAADRWERFEVYGGNARSVEPGNRAEVATRVRVDRTLPSVQHDAPAWAAGRRDVRLSAEDVGSGLAHLEVRVGAAAWQRMAGSEAVVAVDATAGDVDLEWRAADRAGNEAAGSWRIRADALPPLVAWNVPAGLHAAPVELSASAEDAASGVTVVGVRRAGGPLVPSLRLESEGEHAVEAVARDAAGNEAILPALHTLSFPGAAALSASVAPASPRPGESALVTVRLANLRAYALTGVAVGLGAATADLGDLPAGATAEAVFPVRSEIAREVSAHATWRTPWREEAAEVPVSIHVVPLRSVQLVCLPLVALPGAAAMVSCGATNVGDVGGPLTLGAGAGSVTLNLGPGESATAEIPITVPAGRGSATVEARGAPGEAAVVVAVAGVIPRALLLDGADAVNAGAAGEATAFGLLSPGKRVSASGLLVAASDGRTGASTLVRSGPGETTAWQGPPLPAERGAGLAAGREDGRLWVRDAFGPLPMAVVVAPGALAVSGADGSLAAPPGAAEIRYGSWRVQV